MSTSETMEIQAPDGFHLSPQQRRLWLLQKDGTIHLAGCIIAVDGPVQRERLKTALHLLTQLYEILRTTFRRPPGMTLPVQVIGPAQRHSQGAWVTWSEDETETLDLDMFLARTTLDLEVGPLFHAHLTRRSDHDHLLFLAMPALYADDRGLDILVREIADLYEVLAAGRSPEDIVDADGDNDAPLQYADVAEWFNDILQAESHESEKLFWQQAAFEGGLHLSIPFERDAVSHGAFQPETLALSLTADRAARLQDMARAHRTTMPAILLSCWQVLLARLSGQTDITVAVAYDGRNYEGLEHVPGLFARWLPISTRIENDLPFDALLQHTKEALEEAEQKQEYFEWEVGAENNALYYPFAFDYAVPAGESYRAEQVTFSVVRARTDIDRFSIRLSCIASEPEFVIAFHYDASRFPDEHMAILSEQFLTLLDRALAQPALLAYDLDFLSDTEQQRLLVDFNHLHDGHMDDEADEASCFHHRFESQAARTPAAIAVISGQDHLSYRALNARANVLAHHLRQRGAGPEVLVGIYMDRSVELVVSLLGILKAGAAYVPLDLPWPTQRLEYVLHDSNMSLVMTRTSLVATLPGDGPPSLCVDDLPREAPPAASLNPDYKGSETNLAYVMYTSGSTGQPKGVRIEHGALANYLAWALNAYHVASGEGAPVHSSIGFDATITGLFLPLLAGKPVHLLPERDEVEALGTALRMHSDFSLVKLTPAHMELLQMLLHPAEVTGKAKALVIGGEALLEKHLSWWREHAPDTRLINEYGPTETVVGCCIYDVPADIPFQGAIPIGFPIARTQLYILDTHLRPVPRGVVGELYIGGAGLGRDYLDQARLTAEKFVPNPFTTEPGARLYRSGDLARHLPSDSSEPGPLEFLGRVDYQVKLRGFRIELGEIEAVLSTHAEVVEQVVLLHQDATGEPRLVAYVQAAHRNPQITGESLRTFLADRLPEYMVPATFVLVDEFALTPNGKVDRRALPDPDFHGEAAAYVEPRTQIEKLLADLWTGLLDVDRIGIHDDFFRMGGHSLLATRMISQVRDLFEVELSLPTVFEASHLAGLSAEIEAATAGATQVLPPIEPIPDDDAERNLLSFAQQRLWFLNQMEGPSPTYNIPGAFRLKGHLDISAVEQALTDIAARHEILRTRFVEKNGHPEAVIDAEVASLVRLVPLDNLSGDVLDAMVARHCMREAQRPFDLGQGPLLRAVLLSLNPDENILLLNMHHIISDGWSISILIREFSALYEAHVTNRPAQLPPLPVQYADFVHWQHRQLSDAVLRPQLDYWLRKLEDAPPLLHLPTDWPRPATVSYRGQSLTFQVDEELTQRLYALCHDMGVTLFMALLSGYALLLSRYSGQDDIVVGSVTTNRKSPEIEQLIGLFLNTVAFRTDLSGTPTVAELLTRVRRTCLEAFANQDVPFEQLVDELQPERNQSYAPIFQVAFQLLNEPTAELEMPGVSLAMVDQELMVSRYDLILSLEETGTTLSGTLEFSTDLFESDTVERLVEHYRRLLWAMTEAPSQRISDLEMISEAERRLLVEVCNDTSAAVPEGTMHGLFEAWAAAEPDRTALAFDDCSLTYGAVNRLANSLANYLQSLGVGPDIPVGLCVTRSHEMVVGLLGILKSGGAYVPLDPAAPEERLAFMIQDTCIPVLLTLEPLLSILPTHEAHVVCLDRDADRIAGYPVTQPASDIRADNLAYIIYTSGSTGRPKGVQVAHRGIRNLATIFSEAVGVKSSSRLYQFAPLSFDASVAEMVTTFAAGAILDLGMSREILPGPDLAKHLLKAGITHLIQPPSSLAMLPDPDRLPLETLIVASEACPPQVLQPWKNGRRVFNAYGPTEFTVCVTQGECPAEEIVPPIGHALPNAQVYVVDGNLQPVPVGVPGEMLVGGVQLARGYLNRPDLTAERFIPDAFGQAPGARLYCTGDRVRYGRGVDGKPGALEFLGRVDHQIKFHGFRIEPGEIEHVLLSHPDVDTAMLLVPSEGEARLAAFVTPAVRTDAALIPHGLSEDMLRVHLQQFLPNYMIPASITILDDLPLTSNGKIDRRALSALDRGQQTMVYATPVTQVEVQLAEIWSQILETEQVGRNDNFFALGGHSLIGTRVISRIRDVFDVELPLHWLFEKPLLREQAAFLAEAAQITPADETPPAPPAIPVVSREETLPLSFSQQRLWFLDRLEELGSAYHISVPIRLQGNLDVAALEQSLNDIVARHEALRTNFSSEDGIPVQVIRPETTDSLDIIRLDHLAEAQAELEAKRLVAQLIRKPFDLTCDPLLRVTLLRLGDTSSLLLIVMHHIISDGWSIGVLIREVSEFYEARVAVRSVDLPALPIQYADFAVWQRHWLSGAVLDAQIAFWRHHLDGAPELLELPTDRPRAAALDYRAGVVSFRFEADFTARLQALSHATGTTLFMTLLAGYAALLSRYSNQDDVVIGCPIANRNRSEIESLVGFFVNILPLRTELSGTPSVAELLERVRQSSLDAFAHQDIPFEKLVEELQPTRNLSYSPLFQAAFIFQNIPMDTFTLPGLTVAIEDFKSSEAQFDLYLAMYETADGALEGSLEYRTALFEAATISRLAEHFRLLLQAMAATPEQKVADLPLLLEDEQQQLTAWNNTAVARPEHRTLHGDFEARAAQTPSGVALVDGEQSLTFTVLNRRANQVAHHLRRLGVGPEVPVGICTERSIDMVVGLLGILKAGGVYAPLDPSYPRERLAYMAQHARLPLVLAQSHVRGVLPSETHIIRLDNNPEIAREPETNPTHQACVDLAYVLYTSGSTGIPKGVAGRHASTLNRIDWMQEVYPFAEGEVCSQKTSLNFVDSVWEIFAPLLHGIPLVILPNRGLEDPRELVALLAQHRVSRLVLVPSLLRVVLDQEAELSQRLPNLRYCVSSGEALPTDLARRFCETMPHTVLLNLYGSTEIAGDATFEELDLPETGRRIAIGQPISNLQTYILDARGQQVPAGLRGELYVGGVGLSRGYDHMPALTAERFVPHPFSQEPGDHLFRTGDLARYLSDGRIEYLGRADQQVKIRGFRVEPGEIEAWLSRHPEVAQALVTAHHQGAQGDATQLVVYLVPHPEQDINLAALRQWAREQLPGYMVPAAFVPLATLPLTPNGKVDRKALPAPEMHGTSEDMAAPRTPDEALLVDMWATVLGRERVGVHDNFFDLGGHSLLATQVIARVRKIFGVDLPVRTLFESSTVADLIERIDAERTDTSEIVMIRPLPRQESQSTFPPSFAQERVWFLEQFEGNTSVFNMPMAWKLTGALDRAALAGGLDDVLRRHESLRTVFPDPGPDGTLVQVVSAEPPDVLSVIDLRQHPESEREAIAQHHMDVAALQPFNLADGPLLRVVLVVLDEHLHYLAVNLHHTICDGWSISIFLQELAALYTARIRGESHALAPLPFQYADIATWQRSRLGEELLNRQLTYWKQQLGGDPEVLDFPTDHPRPPVVTYRGDRCFLKLPASLSSAVERLAREQGNSLFMTLLAAFKLLLSRHSSQTDILVGTPIAGRHHDGLESQIGMFLNNLVLRTDLSGDPSFIELLQRVRETCLAAYDNQDIPLEKLLEQIRPNRDLSRNSLYQVLFNMINIPAIETSLPDIRTEALRIPELGAKYDFTLYVYPVDDGLRLDLSYNAVLFDHDRMTLLLQQFRHLLAQIVEHPEACISRYDLVNPEAASCLPNPRLSLDDTWYGAIHDRFYHQAAHAPERMAIETSRQVWSYAELAEKADDLARTLMANGVRKGDIVAILVDRSAPLVQAVMGSLRAGAAFLLLDPAYPDERLSRYLELAAPRGWIEMETAGDLSVELREMIEKLPFQAKIKLSDDGHISPASPSGIETWRGPRDGLAWPEIGPDDAAVIGFTSGSTGIPKGIVGRHGPLTHFMPWMIEAFGLEKQDRHSMLSGIAHDPIQRDMFTPLFMGAAICIPDAADIGPIQLARWMKRSAVTVAMVTPPMADIITQTPENIVLDRLRRVFLVGERLTARLVTDLRRLAPQMTVINLFGCTESQRAVSYHVISGGSESPFEPDSPNVVLPLGRGMIDVQLLILNQGMQLAGVGELGDIYIRSPHLARGYLNDEQQTRAAFLTNPFTGQASDRIYKTGDLGRYLPDGNVVYVERSDFQVKIRGFRIEIPEIELTLMQHSQVQQAVVLAHEDEQRREKYLVGYVRPTSADETDAFDASRLQSELYHHLSDRLPAFMIPATMVFVDTIPLTPNNKTDHKALAALPIEQFLPQRSPTEGQTPANPVEAELVDIWADVLGDHSVGVTDDFFELGGHSLRAVQVVARIRDRFAVELPLRALFEAPTIRDLALHIETSNALAQDLMAQLSPVSRDREFPLSFSQQRLWILDRLEGLGAAYNIPAAVQIQGALDVAALEQALNEIVRRHEALRTNFVANDDGQPIQVIRADGVCPVTLVCLPSMSPEDSAVEIRQRATEEAEHPFDLETDRLIRATLLQMDATSHVLLLTMHHIVSDGWSMGILIDELTALYQAFSENRPSPLPELPIQYADYAWHQQDQLGGEALQQQLAYWQAQSEGAPALLELPTDRPRPPVQSYRGGAVAFRLDAGLTKGLNALARDTDTTLYMTLLAGFSALLSRYSGQADFLLGTPVANRLQRQIEPLIGFFVNTLALRMDFVGDPTVHELLARVRRTCLDGFAHQNMPFEHLVQVLRPERDLSYAPVFQAMFVLQNTPASDITLPGLTFSVVERELTTTKFDLTLTMIETEEGLEGRWEYNADIFDPATIERQVGHFQRLLQGMVETPQSCISALPLLHDVEYRMLLQDPHRPAVTAPSGATRVTEQIESWGVKTPDSIAVTFEHDFLTYRELNRRANRFAHLLRQAGVGPNVPVGLCVERSLEMAVGLLAILKAGGAYVPLDPTYPAERRAFMLADSGISVMLTQNRFEAELRTAGPRLLCLDGDLPDAPATPPTVASSPDDLAYVIYTSGSTGQPKGVQISHRSLMVSNQARSAYYGEVPNAFLLLSSVSFDSSVVGIFWTLAGGGTLCLPSQESLYSAHTLTDLIWQYRVSYLLGLPSLYDAILEEAESWKLDSLQSVIVAGEACPERLIDTHLEQLAGVALFNEYGPTEATVWSSVYDCRAHRRGSRVSIGRPIAGSRSYVLDAALQSVPIGVSGELCIGGESLAWGYLQRPALTAERFVPDPYGTTSGARMYRTGDLVRYRLEDDACALEFLGRIDDQVKIRGFRVEPGEIEVLLKGHEGVQEAAVVAHEDGRGNPRLVGYVQASDLDEPIPSTAELRVFLADTLPDYMIPSTFVFPDALPLTPNGKVDRRALLAPEDAGHEVPYEAPATSTEEQLAEVWSELLELERVSTLDNFFDLGGHSLLATRLITRIRRRLGVDITLVDLFREPTLRGLAEHIDNRLWISRSQEASDVDDDQEELVI